MTTTDTTKTCTTCQTTKTLDQFNKDKKAKDGLRWNCKTCSKAAAAARYAANPDKIKAVNADYAAANRDTIKAYQAAYNATPARRYTKYKNGAKTRGLSFELTLDQFTTFWQADCAYCGDKIATVGIDRIDSSIGYTIENCVACCWECNRIKSDRSMEPLNMHMLKMLKHQGII